MQPITPYQRKISAFIGLLFFICLSTPAQNPKVTKAIKTFNDGKIDKGIGLMQAALKKDQSDEHWDILVNMYYQRYTYSQEVFTMQVVAATGQNSGAEMKVEKYIHPDLCFRDLVKICREAGLNSRSTSASQLLRNFFIDYDPDSTISQETEELLDKAEEYFVEEDYKKAIQFYKKALAEAPDYYDANLFLGDSYYYREEMDSAILYFNKAKTRCPDLLEPRKYLVDALMAEDRDNEAMEECIQALLLYPDQSLFLKIDELIIRERKQFKQHWIPRGCEVNDVTGNQNRGTQSVWSLYHSARNEIAPYCDANGVITQTNEITKAKYLEVYSWEKMLKESKTLPKELIFAKKMQNDGYLDCYVFVSMFHFDLYPQYKHFAQRNEDKIREYISKYLIRK